MLEPPPIHLELHFLPQRKLPLTYVSPLSLLFLGMIYIRDFKTQASSDYQDPRNGVDSQEKLEEAIEEERAIWEAKRAGMKEEAMNKLGTLAKTKFGNMSNMLRTFKKNTSDTITLPEFSEHLRRRKLDTQLPQEDQELIFEQLNATARGSIDAGSLSRTVDELSGVASHDPGDAEEMKKFLEESIKEARSQKGPEEPQEKVVAGSTELMKKAIGQKSFDVGGAAVGHEEMNEVVDELFHKKHTQKSHGKFARYLRLTNMNLKTIPFYDLRTEQLDAMKAHAKNVAKLAASPSVAGRLAELKEKRRFEMEEYESIQRKWHAEQEEKEKLRMTYSNAHGTPISPVKTASSGAPAMVASPLNALETSFDSHGSEGFTASASVRSFDESAAAAMGGEMDPTMFNSTYSEYFPPLHYLPNKPVTRDNLSDADARQKVLNERRARRAARTRANMQVTSDRLELQQLDALARSLKRSQSVNEDQIRYQSTIFLHDLKCFKKQPLTRMAKKPNLTKSDRMWGGQISFDSKSSKQDSRDFNTTFRNSFVEPVTDNVPTVDIDAKVSKMFTQQ